MQAVLHGADAVYIGASSHGARKKAANSVADIRRFVQFARQFRVRVYVTVNTIVYENELQHVEALVWDLYKAGVDAIIVQDMSLLRLNLPPIALHASTQCDTRTPKKAEFLEKAGFSQIVLARELSLAEIRDVTSAVNVPVECFVHGALCVCYSGRCAASEITLGRSANRGECAQMCRMPYTLRNGRGEVVESDRYLLSLRDFNASPHLIDMVRAGVSSFKIEGRLKDAGYVKNVTAYYRRLLDDIIARYPDKYCRSSYGSSKLSFSPCIEKSFNRGFTPYFLQGRQDVQMASLATPKSMGEVVKNIAELHNGDGISFFNSSGEYVGVGVNRIEKGHIIGSRPFKLPPGATIHRTLDVEWRSKMESDTARRLIPVDISIDRHGVSAVDARGCFARVLLDADMQPARKPMDVKRIFEKLGGTVYTLREFRNDLGSDVFMPASQLTEVRRRLIAALDKANLDTYPFDRRRVEERACRYPTVTLDARDNVANSLAEAFYRDHGVRRIEKANEVATLGKAAEKSVAKTGGRPVMTTRYCLRREMGCCLRNPNVSKSKRRKFVPPLTISTGTHSFRLDFDCTTCEMTVSTTD
ncbi:MAG: U32 family peptidase [Candidatus Amulumruptor caecigallinarius]|nr:U32 family peptidase [Candidatus Amulumruptor caecigallinarius]